MATKPNVTVRLLQTVDLPHIISCQRAAYPTFPEEYIYTERELHLKRHNFPKGQFVALDENNQVIGYAFSMIVQLEDDQPYLYNEEEMTGDSSFSTHNPSGDTLYGADIAVHPDYRRQGISKQFYQARKNILNRYNLRRMIAYGRLPGYSNYADQMSPETYIAKVEAGELNDYALNAHLDAGYTVKQVMFNFFLDEISMNYCTLLEMPNPNYRAGQRQIATTPIRRVFYKIRVCAVQYQMRQLTTYEAFEQTVASLVDNAETYHCHFLLFPEYFTTQLFTTMPKEWNDYRAMCELANQIDTYQAMLIDYARKYRLYIIGGTIPVLRDGKLYNVAHLFTPNGNIYTQDKLHISAWERDDIKIQPGQELRVFETPLGRIAIQIGYDIEFPEVSRLLTLAGAEVIFVPYRANQRKAYYRVRYAAQACAVMNHVYVVMTGNVGSLPTRSRNLVNYGQAAMLTPSDTAFPMGGVIDEAESDAETVVVADLDLTSLSQQQETDTVHPLHDRRTDLFELRAKIPVNIIQAD